MTTRNGKIARLPLEIRDQLNTRLADGEPGNRLVDWLNSNPVVIKVMQDQFDGRPITEQNLSEWRAGGYEEWLTLDSVFAEARVLSENAVSVADTGITSEHLHVVLIAHHARLLKNWETMPESDCVKKVEALRKLTASIMTMRRAELQEARVQIQRERLELLREKQSLKSASSSKPASSTSRNARPEATNTHQQSTCVSPSGSSIPLRADSGSAESPTPPLSVPAKKLAATAPPLTGRIQPDSPLVPHSPCHPLFPASDPLGLSRIQLPEIAA